MFTYKMTDGIIKDGMTSKEKAIAIISDEYRQFVYTALNEWTQEDLFDNAWNAGWYQTIASFFADNIVDFSDFEYERIAELDDPIYTILDEIMSGRYCECPVSAFEDEAIIDTVKGIAESK